MKALVEKRQELEAKQKALHQIFEEAGPDLDLSKVKSIEGDTAAKVEKIRALNDELNVLYDEVQKLTEVEEARKNADRIGNELVVPAGGLVHPGPGEPGSTRPQKSIGELFVESKAFTGYRGGVGPTDMLDIGLKALFETTGGWPPETTRTGRVVPFPDRPLQVTDLIPLGETGQAAVTYMEETVVINNAAEVAEGGPYPEATLELQERSSPVRKIAVWLPVTDEQLEDVSQARGYVDNRLRFMLRQRLDSQILNGNGVAPNLQGILNTPGIQNQALGEDVVPDAVYKAMQLVRVMGRALPNAVILHPFDWQKIRLLRTADGIYIWGSPSEPGPERIWGLPVAQADVIPEGTGLVGDFANFIELSERRGIEVQISNSHADFFINGKQAIRADIRVALPIYRPTAFCTVTGI